MLPKTVVVSILVGATALPAALAAAPSYSDTLSESRYPEDSVGLHARTSDSSDPKTNPSHSQPSDSSPPHDDDEHDGSNHGSNDNDPSAHSTADSTSAHSKDGVKTSKHKPGHHNRLDTAKGLNSYLKAKVKKCPAKVKNSCSGKDQKECQTAKQYCQNLSKLEKQATENAAAKKKCKAMEKKECGKDEKECETAKKQCHQALIQQEAWETRTRDVIKQELKHDCAIETEKHCNGADKTKCQQIQTKCHQELKKLEAKPKDKASDEDKNKHGTSSNNKAGDNKHDSQSNELDKGAHGSKNGDSISKQSVKDDKDSTSDHKDGSSDDKKEISKDDNGKKPTPSSATPSSTTTSSATPSATPSNDFAAINADSQLLNSPMKRSLNDRTHPRQFTARDVQAESPTLSVRDPSTAGNNFADFGDSFLDSLRKRDPRGHSGSRGGLGNMIGTASRHSDDLSNLASNTGNTVSSVVSAQQDLQSMTGPGAGAGVGAGAGAGAGAGLGYSD